MRAIQQRLVAPMILGLGLFAVACEDEALQEVSNYTPTDCVDPNDPCGGGGFRLDAGGGGGTPDAGAGSDGGLVGGGPDASLTPDSGVVADAGTPDSGETPSEFLNLAGTWQTQYVFDISDYLFGISNLADELDLLDQVLNNNILGQVPLLGPIIQDLIDMYIPGWVGELVNVLSTAATLFEEVDAFGQMNIAQDLPASPTASETTLQVNESWSVMYVRIVNQCPNGRMTTTPVPFPECARVPIPIMNTPTPIGSGSTAPEMQVYVKPFSGRLMAGVPEADFFLEDREVEMEITKLILIALNVATRLATEGRHQTLESALQAAVDCNALGMSAYNFLLNTVGLSQGAAQLAQNTVISECNGALTNLVGLIAGIGLDWDAFEFDQRGHAVDRTPADGLDRPEVLQSLQVQDSIDGRFRFALSSDLGGEWASPP